MLEQDKLSGVNKSGQSTASDNPKEESPHIFNTDENQMNGTSSNGSAHFNQHDNSIPYSKLTIEQLFEEASALLRNHTVPKIINHFNSIYSETKKRFDEDQVEKLNRFLENGGEKEDFKYKHEYGIKFKLLLTEYKQRKNEYYQNLDKSLKENIVKRRAIIEELKALYLNTSDDSKIFEKFKDIKKRWGTAGFVPKSKSSDIYRTYYHHLENFYEYLDLNREFREKDFEIHLQEKLKLIKRAEELLEEPNIKKASNELQYLHKLWKEETGPVAKEHREEIWKQFKQATDKLHERRNSFFREQELKQDENLQNKLKLCNKIIALSEEQISSHYGWQKQLKKFKELQDKFLNAGYVPKNKNKEVWTKYKEANKIFNRKKNDFYRSLKQTQRDNLKKKRPLIEMAEKLKDSEEWEETAIQLKKIQADWKTIGCVSKNHSEKIWNEFESACNHFFNRYYEHKKGNESHLLSNVKKKEKIIEKLKHADFQEKDINVMQTTSLWSEKWFSSGKLPYSHLNLNRHFFAILEEKLKKIHASANELDICKFLYKCSDFNGDRNKINGEICFLKNRIMEDEQKVKQTQTNMEYFSSSTQDNPMMMKIQKVAEEEHQRLNTLKTKLNYLHSPSILFSINIEEEEEK